MTFPNKYRYLLQNVKLFWGLFNKNISLQLKRIGCKLQNFTNLCGIFQSKFGSNYKCVIYGYVKFIEYALLPQFLKLWKIDLKCHFRDEQQISFSFNFTKEVLLLLLPTSSQLLHVTPPSLLIADLSPMYADLCLSFSFFSLYLPYTFRNRPLIDPAHQPCLQGLVMLPIAAKKSTYQG